LKGLRDGYYPLGGGLIKRLISSIDPINMTKDFHDIAIGRYLAATEHELTAYDLMQLGVLTHVTSIAPHEDLVQSLPTTEMGL
jgi:hypothetical protein